MSGTTDLDGEVDEVGINKNVVRWTEGGIVGKEHRGGDLLDVVRLRLLHL